MRPQSGNWADINYYALSNRLLYELFHSDLAGDSSAFPALKEIFR